MIKGSSILDKRSAALSILLFLLLFYSFTLVQGSSSSNPAEDTPTYTVYRKQYDITVDAVITDEEWWQADPIEFELDDGYGNTYQAVLRLTAEWAELSPEQPVLLFGSMEISDETPDDENYFYLISWAPEQDGPGAPGNNIIIVPVTYGTVDHQVDYFYIDYWWFIPDDVQNVMAAMGYDDDSRKYLVEWMMELNNGDVQGCDPICSYLKIAPGYGDYYPEIDEGYVFDWYYELYIQFIPEYKPKIPTEVTCEVSKSEITVGDSVTISGRISPAPQPPPAFAETVQMVDLEYSTDGITWNYLGTAIVDLQGKYSYEWTPPSTGTYQVTARFNGYYKQEAGECTSSITVKEKPEGIPAPPVPLEYIIPPVLGFGAYGAYRWYTKRKKRPPPPPRFDPIIPLIPPIPPPITGKKPPIIPPPKPPPPRGKCPPETIRKEELICWSALMELDSKRDMIEDAKATLENYAKRLTNVLKDIIKWDQGVAVIVGSLNVEDKIYGQAKEFQFVANYVDGVRKLVQKALKKGVKDPTEIIVKEGGKNLGKGVAKEFLKDISANVKDMIGIEDWAKRELGIKLAKALTGTDPLADARKSRRELSNWSKDTRGAKKGVYWRLAGRLDRKVGERVLEDIPDRSLWDDVKNLENKLKKLSNMKNEYDKATRGLKCINCMKDIPGTSELMNTVEKSINGLKNMTKRYESIIKSIKIRLIQARKILNNHRLYFDTHFFNYRPKPLSISKVNKLCTKTK